jgi:hypothetical protein
VDGPAGSGGVVQDGAASDARDATIDCGTPGVIHTPPTVPSLIAAPAGVTLLGGYRGSGSQIYTCTPRASDAGDAALTGTWVNTAVATLYGDNCAAAVQHSYTSTSPPSPMWTSVDDGSAVVGARINALAAPVPDGGDGGATAIPWLLLRAASNSGEGIFTNVTFLQRVDTVGGLGPAGDCDPTSDAARVISVPYSATYFFYTGGASNEAGGPDASPDSADGGVIEAGSDATSEARTDAEAGTSADAEAGAIVDAATDG